MICEKLYSQLGAELGLEPSTPWLSLSLPCLPRASLCFPGLWLLETGGVDLSEHPSQEGSLKSSGGGHVGSLVGSGYSSCPEPTLLPSSFPEAQRSTVWVFPFSKQSRCPSTPGTGA